MGVCACVCGVYVDDQANGEWFLRTLAKFQGSEMSSGYFKTLLAVEHSKVVTTSGAQSRRSQIESCG